MLILRKIISIFFFYLMIIYHKYKYKYNKYKIEIKRLKWIDLNTGSKICLYPSTVSKISTPNIVGSTIDISLVVPEIYAHKFKNVKGCVESSSFYDKDFFYVERFQGINQKNANYSSGHLKNNDLFFGLNYKFDKIYNLAGSALFLAGNGSNNYFHWLIEILPKITVFFKNKKNLDLIDCIVVSKKVEEIESFSTSLKILMEYHQLNKPVVYIDPKTCISFNSVFYITTFNHVLFNFKKGYKSEYTYFFKDSLVQLRCILLSCLNNEINLNEKFPERFFIRRGGGVSDYNERNYNENDAVEMCKKYDIKSIFIENYTFEEQIKLFFNAKLIVAPSGAFFSNLIFCQSGTFVISWLPEKISNFSVYSTLANLFNVNMYFTLADQEKNEKLHGKYYLQLKSLQDLLDEVVNKIKKTSGAGV